jgi:hypothetical protein
MGNRIFGAPKKPEPSPVKTVPSLQEQISILEKRKTHLNKLIEIHDQKAKESKTKDEAIRYLKLKIMYANELKSLYGMLDKLEGLENARQRLTFQKNVLDVTKEATVVIKQNTVDPVKAEDILDDVRDAMDDVNEVTNILSRTDPPSRELQDELDALMAPKEPPVEPEVPIVVPLPEVPVQVEQITTMDKELRMLVAN